jgi:hypothetical protein
MIFAPNCNCRGVFPCVVTNPAEGDIQKTAQLRLTITTAAFGNIGWKGRNGPAYLAGQPK